MNEAEGRAVGGGWGWGLCLTNGVDSKLVQDKTCGF